MNEKRTIRLPDRIPLLQPGSVRTFLSASFGNLVISVCNAILRMRVGPGLRLTKSESGYLLELASKSDEGPDKTGFLHWRGEYDATESYSKGDVVIRGSNNLPGHPYKPILRDGAKAGTYIALRDVPPGHDPIEPNVDTEKYWDTLSRDAWDTLALKNGNGLIIFNESDLTVSAGTKISIDQHDIDGKSIKFRRYRYCQGGDEKYVWLLGSPLIDKVTGAESEPL